MIKQLSIFALCMGLTACGGSNNTAPDPIVNVPTPAPAPAPAPSQPDPFSDLRSTALQQLDNYANSPAVSVAIYHKGEIVFAEAFGTKALNNDEQVDKDTLFQLGSVTKMLTALGAMQMVEQGAFQLNDKLVQALPELQYQEWQGDSWHDISVQHLLTHQSGLFDGYSEAALEQPLIEGMLYGQAETNTLMNPPGKFYNYSNPNFSFLGALIESYSQTDYRDRMKESVFLPLGMNATTMLETDVAEYGNYALGVDLHNSNATATERLSDVPNDLVGIPAGSYTWSTPSDILKMAQFLMHGNEDVLSATLKEAIVSPQVDLGDGSHYGYGIVVSDSFILGQHRYEQDMWYHSGSTGQYQAALAILPEQDLAVAVLNTGPDHFNSTMIAALLAVAELPNPQNIPETNIDYESFANHVGTYVDYTFGLTFEVGLEGNSLTLTIPQFDAEGEVYSRTFTPLGDGLFLARAQGEDYYFRFITDEDSGESVYMQSREVVGIKTEYAPWTPSN